MEDDDDGWLARLGHVPERVDRTAFTGRVVLLAILAVWSWSLIRADYRTGDLIESFLHRPLLIFQEAGHLVRGAARAHPRGTPMTRLRYCAAALALLALPALADPLRIAFVGDVMLAEGPGRAIAAGGDPLAPFAAVLGEADVRIANLECAVSARGQALASKRYTFRADPGAMAVLKGRFDAVSVANNHAGDFGKTPFADTLDLLAAAGIGRIDGGRNLAEAHAPWWIEHKGLRVAMLGYNEFRPQRFEADVDVPGVAWGEDVQILKM